jgi:hypothetical protein
MQRMTAIVAGAGSSPLQCGISTGLMSEVGRHCSDVRCTTALPPKAEVHPQSCYVANVPKGDIQES